MKIKRNIELMKQFEQVINTADEAKAEQLIAQDASFITPASPTPLYGGKGYLSLVHWLRQSFPDVQWHALDMAAQEDKVAVLWECTGTHKGTFMNIPATNKQFKTTFMNIYYLNEAGKITKDVAAVGMIGIINALRN
ncbi:MAG: ester cyclase [Elusimicrobiaceae bacterium]|nr:ester cyclase [Elusimicrobiaceae bacterium]